MIDSVVLGERLLLPLPSSHTRSAMLGMEARCSRSLQPEQCPPQWGLHWWPRALQDLALPSASFPAQPR